MINIKDITTSDLAHILSYYLKKTPIYIQYYFYKILHKQRKYPCGRNKKDHYLCCKMPLKESRVYFNENKTECYCKVCNSIKLLSNHPINLSRLW